MQFDRAQFQQALDVAKLAVDQRDFIPILSHFCFDGKHVTAYNDFIGIRVAMKTNFRLALQAGTLLKLLGSVRTNEIEIGQAKDTVFFKAGPARTGVRARLPYMGEEDFFFKFPTLKRLKSIPLPEKKAERFLRGIELCLASVGDQMPVQMGVTLRSDKERLYMYSTNNKAISRYSMSHWETPVDSIILPTVFCNAILRAADVYGVQEMVFTVSKEFAVVRFGSDCSIYGKLVANKDPLDFEKVIGQHTKNWRKEKQAVPKDFREIFDRALLMLSNDLQKVVHVNVSKNTVAVEAKSSLGKVKSSAVFASNFKRDGDVAIDAELAAKAAGMCDEVFFGKGAVVFSQSNYMHLVGTHQG